MKMKQPSHVYWRASLLGLSLIASCVADDELDEANEPDGHDGEMELAGDIGESVDESLTPDASVSLQVGSHARVCNTDGLGLRQRAAAGVDQEIVRALPEGALVEVVEVGDGWRNVDWGGLHGWSSAAYLCEGPGEEELVPTVAEVVVNGWTRPLAGYIRTQLFRGAAVHNGVDLAKGYGSTVYAAHAGRVTEIIRGYCRAGYACKNTGRNWALDPRYFMSGDKVVVRHSDGKKTVYDHCGSSGLAYIGKYVYPDTPICKINRTGNRSGAHLHFAVIKSGRAVNPLTYVPWL